MLQAVRTSLSRSRFSWIVSPSLFRPARSRHIRVLSQARRISTPFVSPMKQFATLTRLEAAAETAEEERQQTAVGAKETSGQGKKRTRRRKADSLTEQPPPEIGQYRQVPIDELSEGQAQEELEALGRELMYHERLYYNEARPVISDDEYDEMAARAQAIEDRFPAALEAAKSQGYQSRAERVGSMPQSGRLLPARHSVAMMSLENAFQLEDVRAWLTRLGKALSVEVAGVEEDEEGGGPWPLPEGLGMMAEVKIDGLSVSLRYMDGQLVRGATRGNGVVGEDVTANVKAIDAIPSQLRSAVPGVVEVRGEVYMSRQDFDALNTERAENGAEPFSNPRNAASGSLRQLDPEETRRRRLGFFAYDVIVEQTEDDRPEVGWEVPRTQDGVLSVLQSWGFSCARPYQLCDSVQAMADFHQELERGRDSLVFDIDGVVYKLNSIEARGRAGSNARAPRWAIAHKFSGKAAETTIRSIEVQVGRTGMLTPVALLEPITVGGVVISRATLHNFDDLARKAVQVGDRVVVRRAGDVIPQVMGLAPGFTEDQRAENSAPFGVPTACPSCGSPVAKEEDQAFLRCTAGLSCPAQVVERLAHFASRDAFNIKGLGTRRVEELVSWGLLSTPVDIFNLEDTNRNKPEGEKVEEKDGWGELSARNLFLSIRSARRIPLDRFIYGLGILHVGLTTAQAISSHFGGDARAWWAAMLHGLEAKEGEPLPLETIDGIGPIVSQAVAAFVREEKNRQVVEQLLAVVDVVSDGGNGGTPSGSTGAEDPVVERVLEGKRVLFTGTLSNATRSQAEALAKRLGAKTVKAISKSVDYVVVGADAGGKAAKAEELGLTILTEEEWEALTRKAAAKPGQE